MSDFVDLIYCPECESKNIHFIELLEETLLFKCFDCGCYFEAEEDK